MADHVARVIDNSECQESPNDSRPFAAEHRQQRVGRDGLAFSVICCEDVASITRHTLQRAAATTDEGLQAKIEDILLEQATQHGGQSRALRTLARMGKSKLEKKFTTQDVEATPIILDATPVAISGDPVPVPAPDSDPVPVTPVEVPPVG